MKYRICTIFVVSLLLVTGCNNAKTEELYPRLDANTEASKIQLVNDDDIMDFYKLIFPGYKIESLCSEEFSQIDTLKASIDDNTIYYLDSNLECNTDLYSPTIYVKKGQNVIRVGYSTYGLQNDFSDDFESPVDKGCYEQVSGSTGDNGLYYFNVYTKNSEIYYVSRLNNAGYCPDITSFDNEYDQFTSYIYDSFLLIDHSKEITK